MTSPLTGGTLTAQRAQKRWKSYHVAISHPATVFSALINQTFTTYDGITALTYDTPTGTYTDVKPGMTLWIGTSAGAYDVGIVRVRKALTTTRIEIGKTSGVIFANNQYLTVVNDFGLWAKEPRVVGDVTYVDEDVTWAAVSGNAPIVRIGPPAFVLERTGATVSITMPAPTIYSPTGATAASYVWTAPGASATSGLTTATPTFTYNADGEFYFRLSLTDSNGGVTSVTRKVFVNPTYANLSVEEISGDVDSGGWMARITGYAGIDAATLHDRTMVVLYKKDYVGAVRDTSYGPYTNGENIRLVGWIDGDSIDINPNYGTASFTVYGPAYWLDKLPGAPLAYLDETQTGWTNAATLNTDKALYRIIRWHSTLSEITDVTLTGDTTRIKIANINSGSLRQQIDTLAGEKLLARLSVNRFGCALVAIPQSLKDAAGKAALDALWDTSSTDWAETINITRITSGSAALVEIGGLSFDGTTETGLWSRAPGNSPSRFGTMQATNTGLATSTQSICNRLSGDIYADINIEYPSTEILLYWANDFIDIAPLYIVRVTLDAASNPRGITWTTKRFCPLSVTYEFNKDTGGEKTRITLSEETTGNDGVTYFPPQPSEPALPKPPSIPAFPEIPSFPIWEPPVVPDPPPGSGCESDAPANSFPLVWDKVVLADGESSKAYFPCQLRPSSYTNGPSYINVKIAFDESPANSITAYALSDSGARILAGVVTHQPYHPSAWLDTLITFDPASALDVSAFEIVAHTGPVNNASMTIAQDPTCTSGFSPGAGSSFTMTEQERGDGYIQFLYDVILNRDSYLTTAFDVQMKYTVANDVHLWANVVVLGASGSTGEVKGSPYAAAGYAGVSWTGSAAENTDVNPTGAAQTAQWFWIQGFNSAIGTTESYLGSVRLSAYTGTPVMTNISIQNPGRIYNVCPHS